MKRFVLLFTIFSLLGVTMASCSPSVKDSSDVSFEYSLNEEKTAYTIKGSNIAWKTQKDNWKMINLVIPSEYNGLPVTKIGFESFRNCQVLQSVTIPDSITTIESGAFFDCNYLESVYIPEKLEHLKGEPFRSCNSLKTIDVDSNNPSYSSVDGVLYTKNLKELIFYPPGRNQTEFAIPSGVEIVHKYAFSHCEKLQRIIVPASVYQLPYNAIIFCNGLEGITVNENNQTYKSFEGNLYSKDGKTFLRLCVSTEETRLVIPNGCLRISSFAAYYCDNLVSVTISESVTHIGESAFSQCDNLTEANFENPSGWKVVSSEGKLNTTKHLNNEEMQSYSTGAKYLSESYTSYEWYLENDY
ncbi:MAG: leucine-rich repeat protein [Clostridia bacterium]|nr:leucine-rich repeat protein [Clostridia bacterium]